MLEYTDKLVSVVSACTCDRCQRRMTPGEPEWDEKVSISYKAGYYSTFGDGRKIEVDLCQHCFKETLGTWVRATPTDDVI
ncbi:hypothetical protein IAG25_32640 [Caballeronia sp. EK]|nr:hypothetical protein [Caballeronia sp. EK]